MADDEDLSSEQTEKLLQFQDLIGYDDIRKCREILERSNWDIEVAVQGQFAEREGVPHLYQNQREPRTPRTPPVDSHPTDQHVFTVAPSRPRGLWGWSYFLVMFPFRFAYSTISDIFRFFYRLIHPDPRRHVTDPHGDVRTFIEHFQQTYGPEHPAFFSGTYSQALNQAKEDLQFLVVYLHCEDHQHTDHFCRYTLTDSDVIQCLDTRTIFWGCSVSSPEGYRVSQALRESTYPFLALIVLREHRMTVVARLEGALQPEDLVDRLEQLMDDNEANLVAARADREERTFNRSLRDEQDAAYMESLRQDQEKERLRRETAELEERQRQAERDRQRAEEERLEEIARRKAQIRAEMPAEPLPEEDDVIRVLLKLPNGTRLDRRFYRAQTMRHLYNYVFVHEAAPDDFQIVTNFPRKVVECRPRPDGSEPPSFADIGLGKSEMLFVHDNEA